MIDVMNRIIPAIIGLMIGVSAMAQSTQTVKGRVFDETAEETVIGAGVRILAAADSAFVKGATTGVDGRFKIDQIKKGNYIVHISFMGLEPVYRNITVADREVNIGNVRLEQSTTRLAEVQVTGQANPVTLKQDTVQFNAGAFRVREGANLEELLRRIPGMEIDDDGNIKYNGEAIERIEMDGRNFFSDDPRMATRNLPSDMIKNVQVVDKKSEQTRLTGMSDGEKIKVLNLEIKEDKKGGVIANGNVGYGTQQRYKADALVNVFDKTARYTVLGNINNIDGVRRGRGDRTTRRIGLNYDNKPNDKFNVTAEASYTDNDNSTYGNTRTEQLLGGASSNIELENYNNFTKHKHANINSRIEWTPSERTMMVFEPDFSWSGDRSENSNEFSTSNSEGVDINKGNGKTTNQTDGIDGGVRAHFRHTFNDAGRNLYARFMTDFGRSESEGYNYSLTDFLLQDRQEELDQRTNSLNNNFRISTNLSYLEPFSEKWALQLNYMVEYNTRENDQMAYNKDEAGNYSMLDEVYSRGSSNTNVSQRFGAQMRYTFDKSNIYLGMNANPTYTHTVTTQGGVENFNQDRTIWNFSPNIFLELRPTDSLQLNVRYFGRSQYPSMSQLNPARIILSPLNQTIGNPDLLPAFVHQVNFNGYYNKRSSRQSFNIMGRYGYTQNAVAVKQEIDSETGARVTTYDNVNGNQSLWGGFMINTPIGGPKSKWTSFTFGNVMYSKDIGFVNGTENAANVIRPNFSQRISWSGDKLQATVGAFVTLQDVKNSFATEQDRKTWDYNAYGEAILHLPWDLSLTSRLSYQDASGYDDGVKRNFWLLDASLNWSFLKDKNATLELSGYDLLQQRTTFTRRITSNAIIDQQVNGITSYVMLTFSYRFNNMGGGVKASPRAMRGPGFGRGHRH